MSLNQKFANHVYFNSKATGPVKRLSGKILIQVIFVNDITDSWTTRAKSEFIAAVQEATNSLNTEGAKRRANLNVSYIAEHEVTVGVECDRHSHESWSREIMSKIGYSSVTDLIYAKKSKLGVNEAPVIFAFNTIDRSYANRAGQQIALSQTEYSVVFKNQYNNAFNGRTIEHELLHQFGARDLYFPTIICALAKKYLPHSVMNDGYDIDSLTAYIVGLTDSIDSNCQAFLEKTKYLTPEYISAALEAEWKKVYY